MICHVTGAKGLVGQEVCRALAELGEVDGTDVADMDATNPEASTSFPSGSTARKSSYDWADTAALPFSTPAAFRSSAAAANPGWASAPT